MEIPENFTEIDLGISNFDHVIDPGLADALVGNEVFGIHAAHNFNGKVYHKDGLFHEDVWCYRQHVSTETADTLQELVENVNDLFGWD